MLKKLILAAVTVGVLGGTAAQADASSLLGCSFQATTFYPQPPIQFVGGSGTFSFSGQGSCSRNSSLPRTSQVSASGTYNNVFCGTGNFTGTATVTNPSFDESFSFTITFWGLVGALQMTG